MMFINQDTAPLTPGKQTPHWPAGPGGGLASAALVVGGALVLTGLAWPGADPLSVTAALVVFAAGAVLACRAMRDGYPHDRTGSCNLVTMVRLGLTAALIVPLLAGAGVSWAVFALAALALSLDGVDGWLARRSRLTSAFGARFDMEVDAALALVLALNAALASAAGPFALLLGLPRYAFVAAAAVLPWMRSDLPDSFRRKAVCVLQMAVLIALQAPLLPQALAVVLVPVAVAALAWSFGKDLLWLWRRRA